MRLTVVMKIVMKADIFALVDRIRGGVSLGEAATRGLPFTLGAVLSDSGSRFTTRCRAEVDG